jgi:hypothetical protein
MVPDYLAFILGVVENGSAFLPIFFMLYLESKQVRRTMALGLL